MSKIIEITGVNEIISKLRKSSKDLGKGVRRGMIKAGLLLLRESKKIVPVDTGNLKATGDSRAEGQGMDTVVWVVYTAAYAIYVHENLDAAHGEAYNVKYAKEIAEGREGFHKRGKNQQAKFLEGPMRIHQQRLAQIISDEASKI